MAKVAVKASVDINASPDEVFNFVSKPSNRPKWENNLVEVSDEGDGSFKEVRMWMGRRIEEFLKTTSSEPGSKLVETTRAGEGSPVEYERTQTFDSSGDGTRFTIAIAMDDGGVFGDSAPAVERMIQKVVEADVEHLKELIEENELTNVVAKFPEYQSS